MEQWIFYAAVAFFVWAITNIIDKFFLDRKFKDVVAYMLIGGMLSILFLPSIVFTNFSGIPLIFLIYGFGIGVFLFACTLFYIKALSCEDASIVIPFSSLTSVIILAMAFLFLGERLTQNQLLSFTLLLIGGFALVVKKIDFRKMLFSPALKYLLASCFLYAIFDTTNKFILGTIPAFEGFVLLRLGYFFACFVLIFDAKIRTNAVKQFSGLSNKYKSLLIINIILGLIGFISFNMAVSAGSISLISASQGIQYVLVFIFAAIVATLIPKSIKEDIGKKALVKKVIAILIISLGLYLMNI